MKTIPSLAGKVAVVTGASRGVGAGIATLLGEQGATVYVTGRTTTFSSSSNSWLTCSFRNRDRKPLAMLRSSDMKFYS
jgi:NAD(P)-dependent dehydrogenase (short-subunit alcohol dehydrogenase family)